MRITVSSQYSIVTLVSLTRSQLQCLYLSVFYSAFIPLELFTNYFFTVFLQYFFYSIISIIYSIIQLNWIGLNWRHSFIYRVSICSFFIRSIYYCCLFLLFYFNFVILFLFCYFFFNFYIDTLQINFIISCNVLAMYKN